MSRAKINYWVDVAIAITFVLSALSGLVLFAAPSGYQGGRNPFYGQTVLLLSTHTWDTLHTWSSIAMIAGVGAHLALHWNWMVCMTLKMFERKKRPPPEPREAACPIE